MFKIYDSVLQKIKEQVLNDELTKEQLLERIDWLILEEKCRMIMHNVLYRIKFNPYEYSIKDIENVLTEEEKQTIEEAWGEYCSKKNVKAVDRFKHKLLFSINSMKDYKMFIGEVYENI